MKKVVTFGEIMLRLSTPGHSRFVQADYFDAHYGGAEANVAVALAGYGLKSYLVTRLPKHKIGQVAENALRRFGVDTSKILRGGKRLGIYYLENGAGQRPSSVIYDREDSSFMEMTPGMVDWEELFKDADWFHWTGITPALGESALECLKEACKAAKEAGVTISSDLNYREMLWSIEKAQAVMNPLMEYVDVCIAGREDAQKTLGFEIDHPGKDSEEIDEDYFFSLATQLRDHYNFKMVAITLRESYSATKNGWSAVLSDENECKQPIRSRFYEIEIVDRVGGGDSFASGLIYGLLTKDSSNEALGFAVAASCLKHTIPGDFNLVSVEEVEKLNAGGASGRVQR